MSTEAEIDFEDTHSAWVHGLNEKPPAGPVGSVSRTIPDADACRRMVDAWYTKARTATFSTVTWTGPQLDRLIADIAALDAPSGHTCDESDGDQGEAARYAAFGPADFTSGPWVLEDGSPEGLEGEPLDGLDDVKEAAFRAWEIAHAEQDAAEGHGAFDVFRRTQLSGGGES